MSVTSLPPAIIERCRTDARLLAELIRAEAWRLKDEDRIAQMPAPRRFLPDDVADEAPVWVRLFHGCPPGIVDLINSRSCRSKFTCCILSCPIPIWIAKILSHFAGAIMFNDPLTLEQCSDLLDRLVRCAFPFQCAHGRPSMVPLVDLGDGMVQLGNLSEEGPVEGSGESFGRAFKRWKEMKK